MTFSLHPFLFCAILAAIIALIAALFAFRASRLVPRLLLVATALIFSLPALYVFTLFHPELVDARFRTYKAFYRDIHEGMTHDEVLALLNRSYPSHGPRQRPTILADEPTALQFFMNPESSREPNCEGIFLRLTDGRVTKKDYSPD